MLVQPTTFLCTTWEFEHFPDQMQKDSKANIMAPIELSFSLFPTILFKQEGINLSLLKIMVIQCVYLILLSFNTYYEMDHVIIVRNSP